MIKHRIGFTVLLAIIMLSGGWSRMETPTRFMLIEESKLWIEGTSTIHDWTCEIEQVEGFLDLEASATAVTEPSRVEVSVPVRSIECNNGTMNKKTRKALAADAHPLILYELLDAEVLPGPANDAFQLKTTGRLMIAGTTKSIEMTVEGRRLPDGRFRLTGSLPLLMTDFGIDPPKAMLGTLKTGDRVVVHFDVVVAPRSKA